MTKSDLEITQIELLTFALIPFVIPFWFLIFPVIVIRMMWRKMGRGNPNAY